MLSFKKEAERALSNGIYLEKILNIPSRERISRSKYISENELSRIDDISEALKADIDNLIAEGGVLDA